PGARVYPLESAPIADPMAGAKRLPVGWELLGRVLDASGRPLDGLGPLGGVFIGSLGDTLQNIVFGDAFFLGPFLHR
ncbi:hypothetical protein SB783_49600, partial [Paraburkholderia sp. SIMBA_009]